MLAIDSKGKDHCTFFQRVLGNLYKLPGKLMLLGSCLLALVSCTGNTASAVRSTPTAVQARPTATSTGNEPLFVADWTKGLQAWKVVGAWKVKDGYIESDAGDDLSLTLPYQLPDTDYIIEYAVQIVDIPRNGGGFQLVADRQSEQDGYSANILGLLHAGVHGFATHPLSEVLLEPQEAMQANALVRDYEPGDQTRIYRVEVKGPRVNFFADTNRISSAISWQTAHLSHGPIHFLSSGAVLRIRDFRVLRD